eukprot:scaffold23233_cov28-Prasinocladus_malaysianus.AAC.1
MSWLVTASEPAFRVLFASDPASGGVHPNMASGRRGHRRKVRQEVQQEEQVHLGERVQAQPQDEATAAGRPAAAAA